MNIAPKAAYMDWSKILKLIHMSTSLLFCILLISSCTQADINRSTSSTTSDTSSDSDTSDGSSGGSSGGGGGSSNNAPTLTTVSTLTGATEDTAFTISYATLAAAANEYDGDGDTLSFRVEAVSTGTLTKSAVAVTPGSTLLSTGEDWVWTPAADANGTLNAFTIRAYDGTDASSTAIQVQITASAVADAPTLTTVSTLTGATEDTAFTISYATLAAAANEYDGDGDTLSFRVEAVSTGTLTKSAVAVTPGSTLLSTGEDWVWTPAANANGTLNAFTIRAYDGTTASSTAIQVQVTASAVDDSPTISDVSNQTTSQDTATGAIAVSISDIDSALTCAGSLSASSSATSVVASGGIAIGGTAPNCTVTLTPVASATGVTTITLTVSDTNTTAQDTFTLTVSVAIDVVDDDNTATGFGGGTKVGVAWSGSKLILAADTDCDGNMSEGETTYADCAGTGATYSGVFTSRVMDYGSSITWDGFKWISTLPFGKELTGDADDSGAYNASDSESSDDYSELVGSTGSTSDNDLMSNLIGLWHLNGSVGSIASGSTVPDSGPNGYDGTSADTNATMTYASSNFSQGITFDGANDWVSVTNLGSFGSTLIGAAAGTTFSYWIKTTSTTNSTVLGGLNNPGTAYLTRINNGSSGSLQIFIREDSGKDIRGIATATGVNDGSWHHVVFTADIPNRSLRLWLDGVEKALTVTDTLVNSGFSDLSNPFVIGALGFPGSPVQPMAGTLDEVALWSRILDDDEIKQLYRRGANRLKFQMRTCTTSNCSDAPAWVGPDNTNSSYFSELYNYAPYNYDTNNCSATNLILTGSPSLLFSCFTASLSNLTSQQYLQYRAIFESDDDSSTICDYGSGATWCSPELESVEIFP